jgi:transposase-like protein
MVAYLEGLRGERSIANICRKYWISENLYYRWQNQFPEAGRQSLTDRNDTRAEASVKARIFEIGSRVVWGNLTPMPPPEQTVSPSAEHCYLARLSKKA